MSESSASVQSQALSCDKPRQTVRVAHLLKSRIETSPTVAMVRPVLMDRIEPRLHTEALISEHARLNRDLPEAAVFNPALAAPSTFTAAIAFAAFQ